MSLASMKYKENNSTLIKESTYDKNIAYYKRKPTHSLEKINRTQIGISASKQIENKKLRAVSSSNYINTSYQSPTKTYQNYSMINNNSTLNQSALFAKRHNISLIEKRNKNSPSKIKERLLQNLKSNFSQEKIRRKKLLNVNVNVNYNENYSVVNNNNTTQSFDSNGNGNNGFKRNYYKKRDQPFKLYTDANALNHHSHFNINGTTSTNNKSDSLNESIKKFTISGGGSNGMKKIANEKFIDLEVQMQKMFKENKTNSKSKKYNIIKYIFEEGIKVLNGYNVLQNFFRKILICYHEVFVSFSTENKTFKEKMEVLTNKNFQLDKNYIDILKKMKEKENEIEFLKSKVNSLISNDSNSNVPFEPIDVTFNKIEKDSLQSSPHTNKHQRFLSDVNTKNVNDLDSLYFNDKVQMEDTSRSPKPYNIPRLNLSIMDMEPSQPQLKNNKSFVIKKKKECL